MNSWCAFAYSLMGDHVSQENTAFVYDHISFGLEICVMLASEFRFVFNTAIVSSVKLCAYRRV